MKFTQTRRHPKTNTDVEAVHEITKSEEFYGENKEDRKVTFYYDVNYGDYSREETEHFKNYKRMKPEYANKKDGEFPEDVVEEINDYDDNFKDKDLLTALATKKGVTII